MKPLLALLVMVCSFSALAQSNQAFPQKQYYASDYGTWQVQGTTPNTYQFQPSSLCQFPQPAGGTFNAFNQNAPVYLKDSVAANSELLTPAFVLINESVCEVALTPTHNHYSFNLQSGTAGLQEALNTISGLIPYPAQVILDRNWYTAVNAIPGQTASSVIGSVKGNAAAILVDVTQAPTQSYKWNGTMYVAVASGGSGPPSGSAGGGLTGTYPNPTLNAAAQVLASNVNGGYSVEGFTPSAYAGIGQVPVAWVSGTNRAACQEVSYSGTDYLATSFSSTGATTPGTNSAIWYPLPVASVPSPTQTQCAFYWALANAGTDTNGNSNAILRLEGRTNSEYTINGPLQMPPKGGQVHIIGSSQGDNGSPVQIKATAAMGTMILKPDLTSSSSTPYSLHLANVDLNGNGLAQEGFWFAGAKLGLVEHVHLSGFVGTSDWARLGDSSAPSGEGYDYQWIMNDVQLNSSGGTMARVTPVVSGGVLTGITVNSAGVYNYYTTEGVVPTVHIFGTGAGTSNQPCTTMGTATAVMSGSGLASVTLGGTWSGCGTPGTGLFAYIPDSPAAAIGIYIDYVTDSSFTDLVDNGVGTTACIEAVHSSNSYLHAHPYGCPVGIISYNGNMFANTELDSNYIYGAEPAQHDTWTNTDFIFNSSTALAGSKGFYVTNGTFSSMGNVCQSTPQSGGGWALVTTPTGDIAHGLGIPYPGGFQVLGQQCDDYSQVVALPYFNAYPGSGGNPAISLGFGGSSLYDTNGEYIFGNSLNHYTGDFLHFMYNSAYPVFTVNYEGDVTSNGGTVVGSPAGGNEGGGTVNAQNGYYVNGVATPTAASVAAAATTAQTNVIVANVKQYGALGNGASHQACTTLGLANLAALQAYNGGEFSFATACTNQMDWLATQYAVNLLTSTGGSIKLSGGPYIWDQPVILPNEQDSYEGNLHGIYLVGDGEGGTLVEPAVADFGASSAMVSCGSPTASYTDNSGAGSGRYGSVGACYGGIEDITFYNPYSDPYNGFFPVTVTSSTYAGGITGVPAPATNNTTPIQMDGVLLGGRMYLHRVGAWGFRMGFNLVGDHMTWDQLDGEKDFCGLYWAPPSIYLVGDVVLKGHTFLSGNTLAGVCVDKQAAIIGFYDTGEIYTGYQPYGWLKFPGQSTNYGQAYGGSYTPFFANAEIDMLQSEAIGNAVMWDDNLTNSGGGVGTGQSSIGGLTINGIYTVFSNSIGQKITAGGRGNYAYFGSGSFNGFKLGNIYAGAGNMQYTSGMVAGILAQNAGYNDGGIDISGDLINTLNTYTSVEFVGGAASGSTMCQSVALHQPGQWDGHEAAIYPAATEPAVGNLLQVYNYQAGTIANGTQPVIGVAEQELTTNTAGGQCVAYADRGIATVSTTSTPALGSLLVASTSGNAVAATSTTGGYTVGTVHNNITNPPVQLALGGFTPGTGSLSTYAPLASPALIGTPTVPTAAAATNNTQAASTAYVYNAAIIPLIDQAFNSTVAASSTVYASVSGNYATNTSAGLRSIVLERSGVLSGLTVCISGTQSSTGSLVATYVVGPFFGTQAATTQSVTIAASATVGCYTTAGATAAYTAGQGITLQITNNATAASAGIISIYGEFLGAH